MKLKSLEDIDSTQQFFIKTIQESVMDSTISLTSTNIPTKPQLYTYLPQYLKELINKKRHIRKMQQQTHYPNHKYKFNKLINKLKKEL